jgi:hypothetical protein
VPGRPPAASLAIALTMMSTAVLLCVYATYTYVWRMRMISRRQGNDSMMLATSSHSDACHVIQIAMLAK